MERTLKSLYCQTDEEYKILVVCNQRPRINFDHKRVVIIETSLPPPIKQNQAQTGRTASRLDKGCKYWIGIKAAQIYEPNYIMFFDADDLIHKDISLFINKHKECNGFYLESGYILHNKFNFVSQVKSFHRICGTSIVLHNDLLIPYLKDFRYCNHHDILQNINPYFITNILGAHFKTKDYYESLNLPLKPITFPAAMYVVNTSENHSAAKFIHSANTIEHLSNKLAEDFNITRKRKSLLFSIEKCIYLSKFKVVKFYRFLKDKLKSM